MCASFGAALVCADALDNEYFSDYGGSSTHSGRRGGMRGVFPPPQNVSVAEMTMMAVVGGCTVSPQGEVVGSNITVREAKSLLEQSQQLQIGYRSEGKLARLAGQAIVSNATYGYEQAEQYGGSSPDRHSQHPVPSKERQKRSLPADSRQEEDVSSLASQSLPSLSSLYESSAAAVTTFHNAGVSVHRGSEGLAAFQGAGGSEVSAGSVGGNHMAQRQGRGRDSEGAQERRVALREVYQQAARVAGTMHQLEAETRKAERALVDGW